MTRLWCSLPARLLLAVALLLGSLSTAGMRSAAAGEDDIVARLKAVPGLEIVEEKPTSEGFRFFVLSYTQYADHRRPKAGRFQQRLTLLHRGFDRPMVLSTSGYYVNTTPSRSEPARLIDGNQISTEHRFFDASSDAILAWFDGLTGFDAYPDQSVELYVPYYYQQATQIGWPDVKFPRLDRYLKYAGQNTTRTYLPKDLPVKAQPLAMLDGNWSGR